MYLIIYGAICSATCKDTDPALATFQNVCVKVAFVVYAWNDAVTRRAQSPATIGEGVRMHCINVATWLVSGRVGVPVIDQCYLWAL